MTWLTEELQTRDCGDVDLSTLIWSANVWISMLFRAGMFLSEAEDEQRKVLGLLCIRTLVKLAHRELQAGRRLWRLRPKMHLVHHMCIDCRPSRLNPHHLSCWMDEEFIKRAMRVVKAVHKRTATASSLERYLLGLPQRLRAFRAHQSD